MKQETQNPSVCDAGAWNADQFSLIAFDIKPSLGKIQADPASNIVRLNRVFRPRVELDHHQVGSSWSFKLEHVGEHGRHLIGNFRDVAVAFTVALTWRNRGIRVVAVDRGQL